MDLTSLLDKGAQIHIYSDPSINAGTDPYIAVVIVKGKVPIITHGLTTEELINNLSKIDV